MRSSLSRFAAALIAAAATFVSSTASTAAEEAAATVDSVTASEAPSRNVETITITARRGSAVSLDEIPASITFEVADTQVVVKRASDGKTDRVLHGTWRALIANMMRGVSDGFSRKLEIVGVGYKAEAKGKHIQFALGYSHPVIFPLPEGVTAEIDRQVSITLRCADKAVLGQTAAKLRALREPDPYKGKGIRYANEVVRRKVGKKAGAGAK